MPTTSRSSSLIAVTLTALVLSAPAPALAQSDISPFHKFSWQENTGWMNWRDAGDPVGAQGVQVNATFLAGWIWAENAGWITVGDGTPGGAGPRYTNASGADHGVNILAGGGLGGYAWGENIGWVNFGPFASLPVAQRARFDAVAPPGGRFRGYAWGENVGWVNLDDATHYVGVCRADFNGDGLVNVQDFLAFLSGYAAGDPRADFTGDGLVTIQDFLAFLSAYAAGCS